MNNIYVVSRKRFTDELKTMTEQQFMAGAFISILDPKTPKILESGGNVLNLCFEDVDEDLKTNLAFDKYIARAIRYFVEVNSDAKFWLIHCTAGVSRSGAVGEVLSEYFKIPYHQFKRDNPQVIPNVLVKKILREELLT